MTSKDERARQRTIASIEALGLKENLLELETQGFTVVPQVLSSVQIERAKSAILNRVATLQAKRVDPNEATAEDFRGMSYQHYLLYDDPVFPEILMEPKPLALITYLLGESCVLSSMGSHFRGPGGLPLALHADGPAVGMSETSLVANCNYALTPYSQEEGALVVVPGSHRKNRQPLGQENWRSDGNTFAQIVSKNLAETELDELQWDMPAGAITLDIQPGDAVIWHGNTWHGGWRRELPGTRVNLAAYFCRSHMATQERRRDPRQQSLLNDYAEQPRFARLLGEHVFNGWREEGPDFSGHKDTPTGIYD